MKFHLDGARIFNAAVALGVPVSQLVEPFDSVIFKTFHLFRIMISIVFYFQVSVCLSKGLGAPVGSLIVGTKSFIEEAHRCRKALGGGMRQAGIIAAAGMLALQKGPIKLAQDHTFTKKLAMKVQDVGQGIVEVDLDTVETNMLMMKVKPESGATPTSIVERLAISSEREIQKIGQDVRVLAYPMTSENIRIVIHCNNTPKEIELAQEKLCYVFEELRMQNTNGH